MTTPQSIDALQNEFGIPSNVEFSKGKGGLTLATLTAAGGSAQLYLQGAHLTDFTPTAQKPVLFMSEASWFAPDQPIRGGVPVCWPWFGPRPATEGEGPGHGFARLSNWTVTHTIAHTDGRVAITLELRPNAFSKTYWDQPYRLAFTVTVGKALEMSLTTTHDGGSAKPAPFTFSEALHTYFSVGDIRKVSVTGLEDVAFIDKMLDGRGAPAAGKPITFEGETDRVYQNTTSTCIAHDPVLGRRIVVEKQGSKSTVVWNPWIAKAARMEDFGNDEWPQMLCIETANALAHANTLKPGESHTITAKIRVEKA